MARVLVVLVTATLVGALAGCRLGQLGGATCAQPLQPGGEDGRPNQWAASIGPIPQSRDFQAALSTTMQGLDRDRFQKASVGGLARHGNAGSGLWFHVLLAKPQGTTPHDLSGGWEASLAAGAIGDRCAGDNKDLGAVMKDVRVRGQRAGGGGVGAVRAGQIFAAQASGESDQAIVARVDGVVRSFGLVPRQVRVLHPLGPAVYVTATIADVKTLKNRLSALTTAIQGADGHELYEGLYLQIDGTDGTPLLRSATSSRAGEGSGWSAPGIDSLWGINHG